MTKVLLVTLLLLLCVTLTAAQQTYPSTQSTAPSSSGQMTVKGCLSGSEGSYTLTDKSGTTYMLSGDTAKLRGHVGHEVQIKARRRGQDNTRRSD